MRTCVKGCRSNSNEEGVSFFHFPKVPSRFKSDEIKDLQQRRESWFAKIRMKKRFASIDNVDSYRVCSKHFVSGNDKNLMIPPFIQMTTLVHQMLIISPGKPAHLNETSDVDWAPTVSVTLFVESPKSASNPHGIPMAKKRKLFVDEVQTAFTM